jgi:hypothetical protein
MNHLLYAFIFTIHIDSSPARNVPLGKNNLHKPGYMKQRNQEQEDYYEWWFLEMYQHSLWTLNPQSPG